MKTSDKIWIFCILVVIMIHFALLLSAAPTSQITEQEKQKIWLDGYNQAIKERYIPAPWLPEQKETTPVKKPNSQLKEKFKG